MKKNILIVTVIALMAGFSLNQPVSAQTNDATATTNDVSGTMTSNSVPPAPAGAEPATATAGDAMNGANESNAPAAAAENTAPPAPAANEAAAGTTASNAAVAPAAESNATAAAAPEAANPPASAPANGATMAPAAESNATAAAAPEAVNPPASAPANGAAMAPAAESNATAAAAPEAVNPPAGAPANGATMAPAAESNAAATATAAMPPTNPAAEMSASNETAGTGSAAMPSAAETNAQPAAAGNTNAAVAGTAPIIFQDVPLTTAIDSLARLAGINYVLDPKIGFGQPDANGAVKPEPALTIRWENVTAEQALMALLDNYGLQLIENPKTKIARITTKDPTAPPPLITRVVQLKYASTSNMVAAIENSLTDKRSRVVPDARTSQLVIVATESEQAAMDTLISQLDKPTRQVLIETRLVELSSNPSTTKGIDWAGTFQAQNISFGNGILNATDPSKSSTQLPGVPVTTPAVTTPSGAVITPATTTSPGSTTTTTLNSEPQNSINPGGFMLNTASGLTPNIGFLSADGVKAVFSFFNQSSEAQVISTPRVVTLDNEKATITVTRAFPVFNTTAGTQGSPGGSQLSYSNLGTILEVTPRISANDYIWLKVSPSVSSFFGTVSKTVAGLVNQADEFDMRTIDTQVLIPNAHTLVMGGLVKDNPNAQYTKVPILGDIPILGHAFRSENKSMEKDDLIIFITPTIVKDADFRPTTTEFLNRTPRTMKDPMDPSTRLDGAQGRGDWSNPIPKSESDFYSQTPDTGAGNPTATP